ncbi:MAG: very short patch repair endonuclease [Bacteroidales bacterium]|nr:very short patch repair endonuclease [Bacteroidales bacterium]
MTDTMTIEQRHNCMSHIRGKNTKPELKVRRWLWKNGYRYRLNVKSIPGKPDIVLRSYRTAIFVNGCFWHGHNIVWNTEKDNYDITNSSCCRIPQSNKDFWISKIRRNQERDSRNYNILKENGWQVIVVWECQLTSRLLEQTMKKVELLLNKNIITLHTAHQNKPYPNENGNDIPIAAELSE